VYVCKRSSHAPGRWNNGERHTHDVLQVRANVKNNKNSEVTGKPKRDKAFAPGIAGMSGQTHDDFRGARRRCAVARSCRAPTD